MRAAIPLFLILILVMTPAFAQQWAEDIRFVLGVSPATERICGAPGEYATAEFFISSTSSEYENITITPIDTTWVGAGQVIVPPNAQMKTKMNIQIPESAEEGLHDIELYVCADTVDVQGTVLKTCLYPVISVNVTQQCSVREVLTFRNIAVILLVITIIITGVVFFRRRF